jgi:hypothetical protein
LLPTGERAVSRRADRANAHRSPHRRAPGLRPEGAPDYFTDPDSYVPILEAYPALRICLAHFGGAGDWSAYLNHPWHADGEGDRARMSWLAKILDLIRDGKHPSLWTDISYTLFAESTSIC